MRARGILSLALGACVGVGRGGCGPRSGATTPDPDDLPPLRVRLEPLTNEAVDAFARHEAELLAETLAARRQAEHGELPPLERAGEAQPDAWPTVTLRNATDHGLVTWFSGPCARTVALAPGGEVTVELCEGTYDLAAELSAEGFLPFVGEGEQVENGVAYEITFYVVRTPDGRRGRRPTASR
ncbi:MAG: hypothetical protein CMN29_02530 [Sandaracinus sp.]|nr:hypothetical protein [Sandaracinus sp.]